MIEKYQKFVNPTQVALLKIGGYDHIEHQAQGVMVTDLDGTTYIDCLGGYGIFSLGHRHPKVVEAVKKPAGLDAAGVQDVFEQAAGRPVRQTGRGRAGGPAILVRVQLRHGGRGGGAEDRAHGTGKDGLRRHARRVPRQDAGGALGDRAREVYQKPFAPMVPGFSHVSWNDAGAIDVGHHGTKRRRSSSNPFKARAAFRCRRTIICHKFRTSADGMGYC